MCACVQAAQQRPVLTCAFSNVGVDQLLQGLVAAGLRVVRLGNPEKVNSQLQRHTLQWQTEHHPKAREAASLKAEVSVDMCLFESVKCKCNAALETDAMYEFGCVSEGGSESECVCLWMVWFVRT
jgi:hypothetical protein